MLGLIGIVATVWLALTDRLGLYIHPRYSVFTVVMALIAAVIVIAAFAMTPVGDDETEGHDHGADTNGGEAGDVPPSARRRRGDLLRGVIAGAIVVGATVALLVLPPATLTSATATQRSINSGGSTMAGDTAPPWSVVTRRSSRSRTGHCCSGRTPMRDYFSGKTVDVTGFVTPSPDDPENVFYVSRFVVTCCAVDAQPVGVPVHLPGWEDRFVADQWVTATGAFVPNPGLPSAEPLFLEPTDLGPTEEPDQPYVF